ncbi:MAG: DUF488 domain-containing protein [Bacteroidetes bacterium]|nr:DUF488 domain-containing protein [Bacteroidota bacterium]
MRILKKIFTIGYEGRSIDEFIDLLKSQKVDLLIDVRIRANSRKTGFSKTKLKDKLKENNIAYEHHKNLGTPQSLMQVMRKEGHYSMEVYGEYLDDNSEIITDFLSQLNKPSIGLMCYESNALQCHRSVVADRLSKITAATITHI